MAGEQITIIRPGFEELVIHGNQTQRLTLGIGLQGPTGPAGAAGHNHTQGSAATVWTIAHNLGYRPCVDARDTGGAVMLGEALHLSLNVVQITFTTAIAGTARCI